MMSGEKISADEISHSFVVVGERNGGAFRIQLRNIGHESKLPYLEIYCHEHLGKVAIQCFRYNVTTPVFTGFLDLYNLLIVKKKTFPKTSAKNLTQNAFNLNNPLAMQVLDVISKSQSISGFQRKLAGQKMSSDKKELISRMFENYREAFDTECEAESGFVCSKPNAEFTEKMFLEVVKRKTGLPVYDYRREKSVYEIQREKRKKYGFSK